MTLRFPTPIQHFQIYWRTLLRKQDRALDTPISVNSLRFVSTTSCTANLLSQRSLKPLRKNSVTTTRFARDLRRSRSLSIPLESRGLSKILERNVQHTKALTMLFSQMLMMNLMRLPYCSEINIICALKPWKSLMDEHFMNEKVRQSICGDS